MTERSTGTRPIGVAGAEECHGAASEVPNLLTERGPAALCNWSRFKVVFIAAGAVLCPPFSGHRAAQVTAHRETEGAVLTRAKTGLLTLISLFPSREEDD